MYRRFDQPVQEPPAIGSQICLSSDCHCSSHIWSNLWYIFMRWQSEAWQLWLLRADSSCADWSNLRHTGRICDFWRYLFWDVFWQMIGNTLSQSGSFIFTIHFRLFLSVPFRPAFHKKLVISVLKFGQQGFSRYEIMYKDERTRFKWGWGWI